MSNKLNLARHKTELQRTGWSCPQTLTVSLVRKCLWMRAAATNNWDTKYFKDEKDLKMIFLFVLLRHYPQKPNMTFVRSLSRMVQRILECRSPFPGYCLVRYTESVFQVLIITVLINIYTQFLKKKYKCTINSYAHRHINSYTMFNRKKTLE